MSYLSEAAEITCSPADAEAFKRHFKRPVSLFWSAVDHFQYWNFAEAFDLPCDPVRLKACIKASKPEAYDVIAKLVDDSVLNLKG